ncbi:MULTISPECIES: dTMP kinase [Streptomyces]|uniref:Thymidylate kinase n=1 Tax=Streptomyces monashensis TaxID=1678012 RepID=A0A1S2PIH5_9ACTN|nr:hypothetical protein [Streptomyces monashensis]OIJ93589.1 hypothetical protein BIV23_37175 [Streptomyces monashensis]
MTSGRLIVVEGIDGSGKSTLCEALRIELEDQGRMAVMVRPLAFDPAAIARVRAGVRFAERTTGPAEEDVIASHLTYGLLGSIETEVLPALATGTDVVCDRYVWSHRANQQVFGNKLDVFRRVLDCVPKPDLLIHLDIGIAEALHRIGQRGGASGVLDDASSLSLAREALSQILSEPGLDDVLMRLDATRRVDELVAAARRWLQLERA